MKTILVGFDASDASERALGRGADLAEALGARLVVTSVAVLPVPMPGFDATLSTASGQLAAAGVDELELAERHLERARTVLAERSVEAEFVAEVGAPAERIIQLAEQRQADLIVVGTRESGFLARLLQGSVSEDVSRASHRDVLIVH